LVGCEEGSVGIEGCVFGDSFGGSFEGLYERDGWLGGERFFAVVFLATVFALAEDIVLLESVMLDGKVWGV
jgi:hypothetical protein